MTKIKLVAKIVILIVGLNILAYAFVGLADEKDEALIRIENLKNAVVRIDEYDPKTGAYRRGTGFVVYSEPLRGGLYLKVFTAAHVVARPDVRHTIVFFPGQSGQARNADVSSVTLHPRYNKNRAGHDKAVVNVYISKEELTDKLKNLKPVEIRDEPIRKSEKIKYFGFGKHLFDLEEKSGEVRYDTNVGFGKVTVNCPATGGMSGSPLVDLEGRVVGLCSMNSTYYEGGDFVRFAEFFKVYPLPTIVKSGKAFDVSIIRDKWSRKEEVLQSPPRRSPAQIMLDFLKEEAKEFTKEIKKGKPPGR